MSSTTNQLLTQDRARRAARLQAQIARRNARNAALLAQQQAAYQAQQQAYQQVQQQAQQLAITAFYPGVHPAQVYQSFGGRYWNPVNIASLHPAVQQLHAFYQAHPNHAFPGAATHNHALPNIPAIQHAAVANPTVLPQTRRPKPQRAAKPKSKPQPKPPLKDAPFSFMGLPLEIRIMIYKFLLEENANPLTLLTKGSGGQEVVRRGFHNKQAKLNNGRQVLLKTVHKANDKDITHLTPAILRVCKSVYQEAAPILYGQTLEFEHPIALQKFLFSIGPDNRLLLLRIVLRGWQYYEFPAWVHALSSTFERLLAAQNLKGMLMDRHTSSGSDGGSFLDPKGWKRQAEKFSEHIEFWAQCIDISKGKGTARSLLSFSDRVFASEDSIDQGDQIFLEHKKVFLQELRLSSK